MPRLIDRLPLETERLLIRPQRSSDAERMEGFCSDYELARTTALIAHPYPPELARKFIAASLMVLPDEREIALAIADKSDDRLVGCISLQLAGGAGCADPLSAEIGYWIGQPHWGNGYASEAVQALCKLAWECLSVPRVTATVMPDNPASDRVLEKSGFEAKGRQHAHFPVRGWSGELNAYELILDPGETKSVKPIVLVAAAALIDSDGRVLLAQRPEGKPMAGLWEFPGGKVAEGETPEVALIRELKEELDIDTSRSCLAPYTFASHSYDDFHLLMPLFVCRVWIGTPRPVEGQKLQWVRAIRLANYPMPEADIPLIAMIRDLV